MPDFTFLYGGIVGQDLGNTSSEDKDVLPAVEVSEYSNHLKTFEGKKQTEKRSSQDLKTFCCYEAKIYEIKQAGSHWKLNAGLLT